MKGCPNNLGHAVLEAPGAESYVYSVQSVCMNHKLCVFPQLLGLNVSNSHVAFDLSCKSFEEYIIFFTFIF